MYKILTVKPFRYSLTICALLVGITIFSSCSASKQVTRVDADTTIDLSGRWNDTDSRMVADDIIQDCLTHPWINDHGIDTGSETGCDRRRYPQQEYGTYPCRHVYNRHRACLHQLWKSQDCLKFE